MNKKLLIEGDMRTKLQERRVGITDEVIFNNEKYLITFGFDVEDQIRECFCADPRVGSDIHALLTDGCIMISIYLQTGGEPEKLVKTLGENRNEGETTGEPSSLLGAIARKIVEIQNEINNMPAPKKKDPVT